MLASDNDQDFDKTVPPQQALRFDSPAELYHHIPEIGAFTKHRPTQGEDAHEFLERLRASSTPEDAVTYAAFAAEPAAAIGWGVEAIRTTLQDLSAEDVQLLGWITQWLDHPSSEARWRVMHTAMFAPRRSAVVYLGLAVGWSGGALAPNDPVSVPPWRAPKAVNAAVLRAVGQSALEQRSECLARVLDLAAGLFRVY